MYMYIDFVKASHVQMVCIIYVLALPACLHVKSLFLEFQCSLMMPTLNVVNSKERKQGGVVHMLTRTRAKAAPTILYQRVRI